MTLGDRIEMTLGDYLRQTLASLPDACIFMALGTNIPFSMGYTSGYNTYHFHFSLFIGLIAGILASVLLMKYVLKRHIELLSSTLVVVAAILSIAWPHEETATLATRYIYGIGTGLNIVPFIVHCGETVVTEKRGYALGLEQFYIAVGYFLQITYYEIDRMYYIYVLSHHRMHNIFCLCLGLTAFAVAMVVESPISNKRPDNDAAALHAPLKSELPAVLSEEKNQLMEEHKNYVSKNELLGVGDSFFQGLGPLFRMILYRIAVALTFSSPFAIELQIGTFFGVTRGYRGWQWTHGLALILRILGVFGGRAMYDSIGRKIVAFGGLVGMGGTVIAVAVVYNVHYSGVSIAELKMVCAILILMQFFAGLYAPTSTIYLSEAFPMLVKPYFIAICLCLENAAQIALLFVYKHQEYVKTFNILAAAYLIGCAVLFLFTLPETKLTTLTVAKERFRAWKHLRSW